MNEVEDGYIELSDISNELFILNKKTVDKIFKLDSPAECFALYGFYYKTAKWQKTNQIWATDLYVKKCLGWGYDKIKKTKSILKESGLIEIVQQRKDNKINKWYIRISYIISDNKISEAKIKVETVDSNKSENQQVGNPINRETKIDALKSLDICLKNNNKDIYPQDTENHPLEKKQKHKYGEYQHVLLTDDELQKLKEQFSDWEQRIKALDEGIELKGYKYKSHYLAILKWAKNDIKRGNSHIQIDIPEYMKEQKINGIPEQEKASEEQIKELMELQRKMRERRNN